MSASRPGKPKLHVVVSLDVEEEGLFSGRYATRNCTVRNVALLPRLAPLSLELGYPLTLFCAHAVFADPDARKTLAFMRDTCGAEIAAHLHHWSTPPFPEGDGAPARTHTLPADLLDQRLGNLLKAGRDFQGAPLTGFRMGRWDMKGHLRPLLVRHGILVDSSVCPLRAFPGGGPDHFLAPADPYRADGLLVSPVTQIPAIPVLARGWHALAPRRRLDAFHNFAALSANPVWHGDAVMRWTARLHVARGGTVLHFFWHSSEMLPGASPNIPDAAAAQRLLDRIRSFLAWLREEFAVHPLTASQLHGMATYFPSRPQGPGDW
ncbi:MAG: hypothetical protein LBR22_02050 [Desulfovibrio sp.]|jgi:hypothetical protein|nr:hypothetical protein [Desulfovibrio sp.]